MNKFSPDTQSYGPIFDDKTSVVMQEEMEPNYEPT